MDKPGLSHRLFDSVAGRIGGGRAAGDRHAREAIALCHSLLSERGEVSGATLARDALATYQQLDGDALAVFFDLLAAEFSPDPGTVGRAADAYRENPSPANLLRLQAIVESPRQELFRRLNLAPHATATLVELRRRVLEGLRTHPQWAAIEADLVHLLRSWFNRGFLELRRIDWSTAAIVLEKLIQYEAVHQIQGWHDLRRRLQADRRCYAFFHPALPDEPVIFIEVALTRGMSDKVQPLLDPDSAVFDARRADSAIFYSITNCQEGLRGVSFGNFLIKQVAEDLGREFPRLKTFATLSPIPGFRRWLQSEVDASREDEPARDELKRLLAKIDIDGWHLERRTLSEVQLPLTRLCAHYLLHAKHSAEPLDAVARFHLGNGARMERLNWLGDVSVTGMQRSAGLMVNYVYRLADVERNHEEYAKEHKVVASARLKSLAEDHLLAHVAPGGRSAARGAKIRE